METRKQIKLRFIQNREPIKQMHNFLFNAKYKNNYIETKSCNLRGIPIYFKTKVCMLTWFYSVLIYDRQDSVLFINKEKTLSTGKFRNIKIVTIYTTQ